MWKSRLEKPHDLPSRLVLHGKPCLIPILWNIRHEFIWRRTHELASASPPYERVPIISQYTFNNIYIIYLLHKSSSFIRTVYIRNLNIISAYQTKNCFKLEITLCYLVSSNIFKTTPKGAKVKMTFGIWCDVSKQTLTLTISSLTLLHLLRKSPLLSSEFVFWKWRIKGKPYLIILYAIYTAKPTPVASFC